ncbi:MAG: hypothetical protein DRJ64_06245 [Thermoprotei archaeon]|nr:MAG: hypothetical protein DRJ64_06245 [Thermoprotei archaeon]
MPITKAIKLKSLEDLVNIIVAAQIPLVHHLVIEDKHIYFLPFIGLGNVGIIYYLETSQPLDGKYIVYNKFNGKISVEKEYKGGDTRLTHVPIVEVIDQNAFSRKTFRIEKKKKKKKEKK